MSGSRGASPLLTVVAVLLVVGFLYWLNLQARNAESDVPVITEDTSAEVVDFIPAQLAAEPGSLVGETGVLRDLAVSERLGRGVVTVDLDGSNNYPVLLGPDLIQRGTQLLPGDRMTAYGTVYTLNDSIRGEWIGQSAVDAGNQAAIPATSSFVLADSVTLN